LRNGRGKTFDEAAAGTLALGSDRSRQNLEGWTALAALAMATRWIRLGLMVTGNTYQHPAVLAKMATTVDIISGGRLILGWARDGSSLSIRNTASRFIRRAGGCAGSTRRSR